MEKIEIYFKENEMEISLECTQHHRLIAILELLKGMKAESYDIAQNVLNLGKQINEIRKELKND